VVVGHRWLLSTIVISCCGSVVSYWSWSLDVVSSRLWSVIASCHGLSVVSCQSVISCGLRSWSAVGCQSSVVVSCDQSLVVGRGRLCSHGHPLVIVGCCQPSDVSCQSWSLVMVGQLVGHCLSSVSISHHLSSIIHCGGHQSLSVMVGCCQ